MCVILIIKKIYLGQKLFGLPLDNGLFYFTSLEIERGQAMPCHAYFILFWDILDHTEEECFFRTGQSVQIIFNFQENHSIHGYISGTWAQTLFLCEYFLSSIFSSC